MPFNMSKFLEHMSLKQRRETVVGRLEKQYLNHSETENMCRNFVKLFLIDQGAIESMVTDEWSKKITRGIEQHEIEERKLKGENITAEKQIKIKKEQTHR